MKTTMRLYSNPLSPFARKVRVAAHELGLAEAIEVIDLAMSPVAPNLELLRHNPLGKLPTLLMPQGVALFDSSVIAIYLNGLGEGRLRALRLEALGDGVSEAAVSARYESALRPHALQWEDWRKAQLDKVRRALAHFEQHLDLSTDAITIGEISIACALSYLDTRFPDLEWRVGAPALADWEHAFSARPSMRATSVSPSPMQTRSTER
jgi:glutathione S-transferase